MANLASVLDGYVAIPAFQPLGQIVQRTIPSSMGPFRFLPEYNITYPATVVEALGQLYLECNRAFAPLVRANREWAMDYQYGFTLDGTPINLAVQIDMVGLPDDFLQAAARMPMEDVKAILRKRIFEIENSLAMYSLLERIFADAGGNSSFRTRFCIALEATRKRFGMPIALLAVTQQKYNAMKASEFGKEESYSLSDNEVLDLSGFDRFFSPKEFKEYLVSTHERCDYLLYVRSSDPVAKLKDPSFRVEYSLLDDLQMRMIIKAHAITFNIDAPGMPPAKRINDTKEYMPSMGMAFPVTREDDIWSPELMDYLNQEGMDIQAVESGIALLRCKPLKGTYGCYGHISGALSDGKFRRELRRSMRQRGGYVIQPEMMTPSLVNTTDGKEYTYIDRNFMAIIDNCPKFLGGFRSLMPADSFEAKRRRIHGNSDTVLAEIVSAV